jgi:pimeloyl-ACP methyl ester carboxylesterase
VTLNVQVHGDGPPVLLLHGFPDSSDLWQNQIPALVDGGFRVVAPDLRGFGESDRPEEVADYHVIHSMEDAKGILDHLEIERAHVVGHDWGAAVAWVFGSIYPDRTTTLTAMSVGHPASFQSVGWEQYARSWYMFMFQFEGVAEDWLSRNDFEFARAMLGRHEYSDERIDNLCRPGALTSALNWYRANVPAHSWISEPPDLPAVQSPTMGIWSTGDIALSEDQMTGSQKHVSGPWRYERVEGAGHWMQLEEPERVNELLLDFFATAR